MPLKHDELPLQFIRTQQIFNLRDVGGYQGADGHQVRSGKVFRSDSFSNATEADLDHVVNELKIRHVVDLRREAERQIAPPFPDTDGIELHHKELIHLTWERFHGIIPAPTSSREQEVEFLSQRYTAMLETGHESVRQTLDLIAGGEPVVFHCMAGKDRTGIIAAVLLGLLGVSEADIAHDYALTNIGSERWREWWHRVNPDLPKRSYLGTPEEAMIVTLQNLRQRFGSIAGYAQAIGFTGTDRLREELLTP